jgi:hypothetical protein
MFIPAEFLAPGTVTVHVRVLQIAGGFAKHVVVPDALTFNLIDDFSDNSVRCGYQGVIPGHFRPRMKWLTESTE